MRNSWGKCIIIINEYCMAYFFSVEYLFSRVGHCWWEKNHWTRDTVAVTDASRYCPSFHFPEIHVHFYLPTYPHKYRRILWPSGNHLRNFLCVKRDYIFDNLYEGRRTINIEKVRQYGELDPKFLWWALRNPGFVKVLFKVTKRSRGSDCQIIWYNA